MGEPMLMGGHKIYYIKVCPYDTHAPNEWAYIYLDGSRIDFAISASGGWARYVDNGFDMKQISDLIGRFRTRTGIRDYIKERNLKGQVDYD